MGIIYRGFFSMKSIGDFRLITLLGIKLIIFRHIYLYYVIK